MITNTYPSLGETVRTTMLDNGLRVITVPRQGFSKSYAFFAVNYGGMNVQWTENGKICSSPDGTAHFLEHKMFDLPEGNADLMLSQNGAFANAFTSSDMTAYLFESSGKFMENLEILLRFVTTPYFTRESVQKEMGIISQEIGMSEDDPYWQLNRGLMDTLYRQHNLRSSTVGSKESISRITPEVLYGSHRAFYVPSNMALCCVGDMEHEAVVRLAEKMTPKEPGNACKKTIFEEPKPLNGSFFSRKMEISRPLAALGFKLEPPKEGDFLRQSILFDLASAALLGTSAPLYNELYASSLINGSFDFGCELYEGAAYCMARGECDDSRLLAERILGQVDVIRREGIDKAFFSRLIKSDMGSHIKELNSFEMTAWNICDMAFRGEEYYRLSDIYGSVTAEEAADFITTGIREDNMATAIIEPM